MGSRLRPYLPNRSDRLALVSLDDERPFRAYQPIRLTQILGGRTWSLSLVRHTTQMPCLVPDRVAAGVRC